MDAVSHPVLGSLSQADQRVTASGYVICGTVWRSVLRSLALVTSLPKLLGLCFTAKPIEEQAHAAVGAHAPHVSQALHEPVANGSQDAYQLGLAA